MGGGEPNALEPRDGGVGVRGTTVSAMAEGGSGAQWPQGEGRQEGDSEIQDGRRARRAVGVYRYSNRERSHRARAERVQVVSGARSFWSRWLWACVFQGASIFLCKEARLKR
jgi:hypothetical protein